MQRLNLINARAAWRPALRVAESAAHEHDGRVLFAAPAGGRPVVGLRRAAELAWALGAELHVLRVVPGLTRANVLFPQLHIIEAMTAVSKALLEARHTQDWCDRELPEGLLDERLHVRTGAFVDEAAACALELDAELIVVPSNGLKGADVASLGRAAGRPVLAARPSTERPTIVAATNLEDEGYPVLRRAAALGRRLEVPVVAVHNVTPRTMVAGVDTSWLLTVLPGGAALDDRRRRLAKALERCGIASEAVVASEHDPAQAILGQARARDADIIVVGTRPRSWLGGLSAEGVAAKVVDEARRSVLVTPYDGAEVTPPVS